MRRDGLSRIARDIRVWLLLVVALGLGAGCGNRADRDQTDVDNRHRLSPTLARIDSLQRHLFTAEDSPAPYGEQLRTYVRLREGLNDPRERTAAEDSLFLRWEGDLHNFLWIDVAVTENRFLRRRDDYRRLAERATGDDSTSAAGKFAYARRKWSSRADAADAFWAAASRADELDPLQRLWLDYCLGLVQSRAGRHADGIERLASRLEDAWREGGPVLAAFYWDEIARFSLWLGQLDDALMAVGHEASCARRGRTPYLEIQAQLLEGQIHDARCEFEAAREIFTSCEARSRELGFVNRTREAAGRLAILAHNQGDLQLELEMIHRTRDLAVASRDTFGVIKSILGIASVHQRAVDTDSTRIWMRRAEDLDATWISGRADRDIAEAWAWIYVQEGKFAAADSLLVLVQAQYAERGDTRSVGSLQIDLIQQALESGRIDLAIRHLAAAEAMSTKLFLSTGNYDPAWELMLMSARVRARQGDFATARAWLRKAAAHPLASQKQHSAWRFQQCRAELAELAGDQVTAADAYRQCLQLAEQMDDDSLLHRSQVLLGQILIRTGRLAEARDLFAANRQMTVYWPRLAATLFTGIAWSREGDYTQASRYFDQVDDLLGPDTPCDLRARLRLEQARAAANLGNASQAERLLSDVVLVREATRDGNLDEVVRAAQRGLARDVAEFTASLLWDHPDLRTHGERASAVLERVARVLWGRKIDAATPAAPDDPLAIYLLGADRAFVWIGSGGRWSWQELADRQRLGQLARDVVTDMEYPGRSVDWPAARELAATVLGPVWSRWPAGRTLCIVPDGELVNLPWAALPAPAGSDAVESGDDLSLVVDHGPVRIDEVALGSRAARNEHVPAGRPILVLADNGSGDDGGVLRQAEAEGRAVAALWSAGGAELLTGSRASWAHVRATDLSRFGAVHVASHATFLEGAPEYSTLRLAGSAAGALTIGEIRRLPLRADLVYLSCCETARIDLDRGTAADSFVRAFLAAGAEAVIAPSVKIDDDASRALAEGFYRHWLAGATRAAALQAAQVEVRECGRGWRHPYYWAFTAVHAAR